MGIKEEVHVTCDVCGVKLHGDYMTVEVQGGGPDRLFCVCLPRTAAINPCGNILRRRLLDLFPKAEEE